MKLPQSICSLAAVAAFSTLSLPLAAAADTVPTYASHPRGGETIHGTIASLSGNGDIYVRDDRGFVDHVTLHQGTVIEPTGFELASGDVVTISGQNAGAALRADEIDAASTDASVNGESPADYGDQGYAVDTYPDGGYYPYGYGYPYGYDYGGIGFYFGGGYGRGGYGGYHNHGGYNGHGYGYGGHGGYNGGSYGRGGASFGRGNGGGGSRGFSGGGGSRGFSGGGGHGGGGHR